MSNSSDNGVIISGRVCESSEMSRFWVRIGDYGSGPMGTSIKDEFMAKQCFLTYKNKLHRLDVEINPEDKVLVCSCVNDIFTAMDKEIFFEGAYEKAVSWSGEKLEIKRNEHKNDGRGDNDG